MGVASLFLKTLFTGLCLVFLGLCFKKLLAVVLSLWHARKKLTVLKALIQNDIYDSSTIHRAIKYYIPPKCQDIPPYKKQARQGKGIKRKDLTRKIDTFLDHDISSRHLLLLAEPGMGKTSFAINYFAHNSRRPKKDRHKIVLVPLGYRKAEDLILAPANKADCVLFLDGFDEDLNAAENRQNRLRQLMDLGQKYKRIILTCSPDFFPTDKNMPDKTGYERMGPENIDDSHYYEFRKLHVSALSLNDIKAYINSRFSFWDGRLKKRILSFVEHTPTIKVTPLLLNHLQEVLQPDTGIQSLTFVYEKIIAAWINREPHWNDKSQLDRFARMFAVDLYTGQKDRGMEAMDQNDLAHRADTWKIPFYPMDGSIRSLITQSQTHVFKFAHRSFMEYIFIKQLISGDKACYSIPLTHQMGRFLLEMLENKNPETLKIEFNWLSRFELIAHGLTPKPLDDIGVQSTNLFDALLRKNQQFDFLAQLDRLIQNPIFYEFGWDPKLNKNLITAVHQKKSSLMKLSKKNWTVMIHPHQIDITKRYQKNEKILITEKDFKEYSRLSGNIPIQKLSDALGLDGLILLNNINQSKNFCAFPDIKTCQRFTLYFWVK